MSSLDLEIDTHVTSLELEWRQAYEASINLRTEYQALAANPTPNRATIENALERLDRTEA